MENMTIFNLMRPASEETKLAETLTLGFTLQIYVTIIAWHFSHSVSTAFYMATLGI